MGLVSGFKSIFQEASIIKKRGRCGICEEGSESRSIQIEGGKVVFYSSKGDVVIDAEDVQSFTLVSENLHLNFGDCTAVCDDYILRTKTGKIYKMHIMKGNVVDVKIALNLI